VEEVLLPKGEISLFEAIFLGSLVKNLEDEGPIIEIGTLFGRSTLVMATQKSIERKLVTVDNYSWNPLEISTETHFRITQKTLLEAKKIKRAPNKFRQK
jgi:predicted O-methyltransferase YrrM